MTQPMTLAGGAALGAKQKRFALQEFWIFAETLCDPLYTCSDKYGVPVVQQCRPLLRICCQSASFGVTIVIALDRDNFASISLAAWLVQCKLEC